MTPDGTIPPKEDLPTSKKETKGVKILLGDPKKAIIKLAVPMIIAMSANTIYNLVDAIWVAGLGPDALAAVGFFFPFLMVALSLAVGLGVGGAAAISRRIGAKDKKGADNVAVHTIIFMVIISAIFSILFFIFAEEIFRLLGAGDVTGDATAYGRVLFGGSIVIFYTQVATAILRAEGDVNRAMYALILGAALNIVLDPFFIYTLDMGVVGAAWATLLSLSITCLLLLYWMFFKKDTYITFNFRNFSYNRAITKDIFGVGLPAMVMQLSMSISMIVITFIAGYVGGTDGVAAYTTGWRVAMIAILPLLGIATAVVSVTGAAYGASDIKKLKTSFLYAVKIGVVIEGIAALLTFIFAPQITSVFTRSEETLRIADDITDLLRIMAIFYPGVAFGMFSSSMFQGTGKGNNALIVTIVRTLILGTPLSAIFAISFDWGLPGVWWGMVVGNLLGSFLAFSWANIYIRQLRSKWQDAGFSPKSATKSK
ncbi:MAG: MATE family efflux transporter [Thermoplasmata archaeon]|nr:MAG: MATE family efflux transporter [Thermoplasmata archaeon]